MSKECLNCGYNTDSNYCPECGQKARIHRLTLREICHEVIHYFTHADKSLFRLLKELCIQPGKIARQYVLGKRKKYFSPLNFYLLVATVFVLVVTFLSTSHVKTNVLVSHPEIRNIPDKATREKVIKIYQRQEAAVNFINKYSNIVAMIALPLICFIYWIFYRQGIYNYAEHLVACMYMTGFTNLFYALLFVPISLLLNSNHSNSSLFILVFFILFQISYNSIFYYHFMNRKANVAALKSIFVTTFVVLFWFGFSGFLVGLYISNGFWGLIE